MSDHIHGPGCGHPTRSPDSPDLPIPSDLAERWGMCADCMHSPGAHGGIQLRTPGKPCHVTGCSCSGYREYVQPPRSLDSVRTPRHSTIPQHTAIYADLDTIIQAAERATNLLHDAESDSVRTPDLDVLGLSDEQTRNLRKHLADRQQTLGEWIGDVLFDMRLGRPDGLEYPPASAALHPASPSDETPATGVEE
jgi:hypothetical protein